MFYLYLKTHNVTGLKYLGQTIRNPFEYQGSGIRWLNHIKKHGYDVTTIVLYETIYKEELSELGLYFSDLWNIVDSREFANLIPESGVGGNFSEGYKHTNEAKHKISEAGKCRIFSEETKRKIGKGNKNKIMSEESKQKMCDSHKGKTRTEEHRRNIALSRRGKTHSEETKRKMSERQKGKKIGPQTKTTCPHCGKTGGCNAMTRYHFDNCKLTPF